jgi:hypothetical protein
VTFIFLLIREDPVVADEYIYKYVICTLMNNKMLPSY